MTKEDKFLTIANRLRNAEVSVIQKHIPAIRAVFEEVLDEIDSRPDRVINGDGRAICVAEMRALEARLTA